MQSVSVVVDTVEAIAYGATFLANAHLGSCLLEPDGWQCYARLYCAPGQLRAETREAVTAKARSPW
jgi:hypothetical protein